MNDSIYKIFRPHEWSVFKETCVFTGSVHDVRDGFIHLCAQSQVEATLDKHYEDAQNVVLAQFCSDKVENVRWETSQSGQVFPHIYGSLDIQAVENHVRLTKSRAGIFILSSHFTGRL